MINSVRHRYSRGLLAAVAAGLTLTFAASATAATGPPRPGTGQPGVLRGVAALSPRQAWAVGYTCVSKCGFGAAELDRTLILHWNGAGWSRQASPDPDHNGALNAVAAASPSGLWAVGSYCAARCGTGAAVVHPLILRGNGAGWTRVASPDPAGAVVTSLTGVSGRPGGPVWAVGTSCTVNCAGTKAAPPPRPHSFILRWTGTAWQQVASPDPGGRYGTSLDGVTALSPDNAWASGNYGTQRSAANFTPGRGLVLHWNGHAWALQPSPSFGQPAPGSVLHGVSALSPSDVLAAGSSYGGDCECARTLGLSWTGTNWAKVSSPSPGPVSDPIAEFFGVSAVSPRDGWAVGYWESSVPPGYLTLITRWNGASWSKVPSPNVPAGVRGGGNFLNAVSAVSPGDVWAAGYYVPGDGRSRSLLLHWNGSRWARA